MTDLDALREAFTLWDKQSPTPETIGAHADAEELIFAAARELLAGQKVWWCLEHEGSGNPAYCVLYDERGLYTDPPCRMVEALLTVRDGE